MARYLKKLASILLLVLFHLTSPMFAKVLVKRQVSPGIQKILQDFTTRLNQLEDTQQEDRDSLESVSLNIKIFHEYFIFKFIYNTLFMSNYVHRFVDFLTQSE